MNVANLVAVLLPLISAMGSFLFTMHIGKNMGRNSNYTPSMLYFKVTRLFTTILLLLTILVTLLNQDDQISNSYDRNTIYIVTACGTLLTSLAVLGLNFGGNIPICYADLIFFSAFGAVAYHDLWPFFTYEGSSHQLHPYRMAEDVLLCILGVIIPLTSPRQYTPINDRPLLEGPHPEQTASLLSLVFYSWLDKLIREAYKSRHLTADALFPLADYDHVAELVSKYSNNFKFHGSHIFFGLMKTFSSECFSLIVLTLLRVILILVNPFALQQFLEHLETQGKGATVYPAVWIVLLFLGPTLYSIIYQWSIFIETRMAVRTEALLSDLIFKHTLRIRLRAEKNDAHSDGDRSVRSNLAGTINNHMTTDLTSVTEAKDFIPMVVGVPVQIILCIAFLHRILGWSALIGSASMIILMPVPGYIGRLFQSVETEKMKKTDGRVQLVSETMTVLRMVKLFGWERLIYQRIQNRRVEELSWTRKRSLLYFFNMMISFIIPIITMLIIFATYTLVFRRNLTASIVFSSVAVVNILTNQLQLMAMTFPNFIQAKVALGRIDALLSHDDIVGDFSHSEIELHCDRSNDVYSDVIGFSHATFSWTKSAQDNKTVRIKPFMLVVNDELVFRQKELNLITGPTGSGKSSLLMALLGEMHFHPSNPSSWYNLPRQLGVAYAAQESWILNRSIRDNILLASDYDEGRYKEVLFQCALEPDLECMEHGDLTEVGERGVTLSGGQKARVTLARAIYSSAEILLLDDVFAALDVHTGQWILDNCFRGKLVTGRTIIMTTHNVPLFNGVARYLVTLGNEGQVKSHGPLEISVSNKNVADVNQNNELETDDLESAQNSGSKGGSRELLASAKGGMLTTVEEIAEGHVSWPTVLLYLIAWGGRAPVLSWGLFTVALIATHISKSAQSWFLGYWAEQYQESSAVNVGQNVAIYALILFSTVSIYSLSYVFNLFRSLKASKVIHDRLMDRIFGATFRWLDTTPVARIITRCTQDIGSVDGMFPLYLSRLLEMSVVMLVQLAAVVYLSPPFALPGVVVAMIGGWCGQLYMKAELSVKRELSNAKGPLLAHLETALAGLVSIRAFGAQGMFIKEYYSHVDHYSRVACIFYALNCWVSVRLEPLAALFTASLATYLMYGRSNVNTSNVGFSLDMAVSFSELILWWIITYNQTEINGNSLERIGSFLKIEQETEPTVQTSPPAYWPASGDLRVENLSARYSTNGPDILHDLSFHIRPGERIGIVGRTGSGKSSLSLALLRCLPTEGNVYYDGILTSSIDLATLRSSLTIVPQSADLLDGTIRQNLDPFDQFDDATLNNALRSAGLSELQQLSTDEDDRDRLTLDLAVTAGGTNLSVGQRQIVALARAMVRESKLLILDEATSAIDHKTEATIQRALRNINGATQLVIAHRLQSVMDADRIMALDAGHIVEFDTPSQLLEQEGGIFRTLVYASKDRETLLAMVKHSA